MIEDPAHDLLAMRHVYGSVSKPELGGELGTDDDDVLQDVTLRIEFMTSREITIASIIGISFSFLIVWASVALTVTEFKASKTWSHGRYFLACTVVASCLLFLVLGQLLHMAYRIMLTRKRKMTWGYRRKRLVGLAMTMLVLETVSLVLWLANSALQMTSGCNWMASVSNILGYLQWSLIFTNLFLIVCGAHDICCYRPTRRELAKGVKQDPHVLVMDSPLKTHAPKILLWLVGQLVLSFLFWQIFRRLDAGKQGDWHLTCLFYSDRCKMVHGSLAAFILMIVLVIVYFLFYAFYLYRANRNLRTRAYSETRTARTLWYFQTRQTLGVFLVLVISTCMLMLPKLGSCWGYILIWLGPLPVHAALVECFLTLGYAYMPKNRDHKGEILQTWLQEFGWTEEGLPAALAARNRHLASSEELAAQPMLCIETAIKMLYWTSLVYDIDEVEGTPFDTEYAKSLYDLHSHELLWDTLTDTKALVAWSDTRILVAFAGTKSMANVMTDLKALTMYHLPKRRPKNRRRRWGGHLRVHKGFYTAYCHEGYNTRLMELLRRVRDASPDPAALRYCFTGHSLGGALTTLAAHELVQNVPDADVTVYTFGAPRVGTRLWASEYGGLVRAHFAVICDQDPVPRVPKGLGYKRVGERIVLDRAGNLMVRPSPLETAMWNCNGGYVRDHLLSQYRASLASIVKAQFGDAALRGGRAGARALARALDLDATLLVVGCDLEALEDARSRPLLREVAERVVRRAKSGPLLSRLPLPGRAGAGGGGICCGLTCAPPGNALPGGDEVVAPWHSNSARAVKKETVDVSDGDLDGPAPEVAVVPGHDERDEVLGAAPTQGEDLANEAGTAVLVERDGVTVPVSTLASPDASKQEAL